MKLALKLLSRPHVFLYRMTGGRIGGRIVGCPALLLATVGRRSGKRRTVPLLYLEDGEALVVIASMGGSPRHPDWYFNLQKDPRCTVQVRGRRRRMTAADVEDTERTRLWDRAVALYPGYAGYQAKTARRIPVVRLRKT